MEIDMDKSGFDKQQRAPQRPSRAAKTGAPWLIFALGIVIAVFLAVVLTVAVGVPQDAAAASPPAETQEGVSPELDDAITDAFMESAIERASQR